MPQFNFQLKPYRGNCIQWLGVNAEDVIEQIRKYPGITNIEIFRLIYIMIRYDAGVHSLKPGDWVVIGEDGDIRFYSDEQFLNKYESLPELQAAA